MAGVAWWCRRPALSRAGRRAHGSEAEGGGVGAAVGELEGELLAGAVEGRRGLPGVVIDVGQAGVGEAVTGGGDSSGEGARVRQLTWWVVG